MEKLIRSVRFIFIVSLLFGLSSLFRENPASCQLPFTKYSITQLISLDQYLQFILEDQEHSPLVLGEHQVRNHPIYKSLEFFAGQLETQIEWVDSVPKRILEFPSVSDRMKVDPDSKIVGWFDEYTNPNMILLDRNTNLSTLIHELRHTIHLGKFGTRMGNPFDRNIQNAKAEAAQFREDLKKSDLPGATIQRLHLLSIRFVESASEVMAYSDDLGLALSFHDATLVRSLRSTRSHQWRKFLKLYRTLKDHPISQNRLFLDQLQKSMKTFYAASR